MPAGLAYEIKALVDASGKLIRFESVSGQARDLVAAPHLLDGLGIGSPIDD